MGHVLDDLVVLPTVADGVEVGVGSAFAELLLLDLADRARIYSASWWDRRIAQFDSGEAIRLVPRSGASSHAEVLIAEIDELARRCEPHLGGLFAFELTVLLRPGVSERRTYVTSATWFGDANAAAESLQAAGDSLSLVSQPAALTISAAAAQGGYVFEAVWRLAIRRRQLDLGELDPIGRRRGVVYLVRRERLIC
jgi:hypothetical protein